MTDMKRSLHRGNRTMGQTIVFALLTLWASTLSFAQGSEDPLDSWVWRNPLPTGGILWKSAYANDLFMTVGSAGEIMATPDGQSWTYLISGTNETLNSVTYGNGVYVAVGEAGTIVTSANGIDWTVRTSGTTERLFGVTYGNDRFIVVGFNGTILSSANGTTWQAETSGSTSRLGGVIFAGNQFVAVGGVQRAFDRQQVVDEQARVDRCECADLEVVRHGQFVDHLRCGRCCRRGFADQRKWVGNWFRLDRRSNFR